MRWVTFALSLLLSSVIPFGIARGEGPEWSLPFEDSDTGTSTVTGKGLQLINHYRQPNSEYSAGHRGVDYQVSLNQTVLAPADGQVRFVGVVVDRPLLTLSHPGGEITEFEPLCTDLKVGDLVSRQDPIGWVCDAKPSYRKHCQDVRCLHFSLRKNDWYLSPLALIGGLNPSRLLPTDD